MSKNEKKMTKFINQPVPNIEVNEISWTEFVRAGGSFPDNNIITSIIPIEFIDTQPTRFADTAFDDIRNSDV